MGNIIVSLSLYFLILMIISAFVPASITSSIDSDINITASVLPDVDESSFDLGGSIGTFLSFFSFSLFNPLGMPSWIAVILSFFNTALLIIFIYAMAVLIRGGGGI